MFQWTFSSLISFGPTAQISEMTSLMTFGYALSSIAIRCTDGVVAPGRLHISRGFAAALQGPPLLSRAPPAGVFGHLGGGHLAAGLAALGAPALG